MNSTFIRLGSQPTVKLILILLLSKLLSTCLAVYVFSSFSPLTDANHYLAGYYVTDLHLRTRLVQAFVLFLSHFLPPLLIHYVFGVISCIGLIYYLLRDGRHPWLVSFLFLPTAFVWTSVIGKEPFFYGFFVLAIVTWSLIVSNEASFLDFFLLIISLVFLFLLRPHYAFSLLFLVVTSLLILRVPNPARYVFYIALITLTLVAFSHSWESLLLRGFGGIDPSARASRFISFGIDQATSQGFERFKNMVPIGLIVSIIGPTPLEVLSRPLFLPYFIEGLFIISFPFFIYFSRFHSLDGIQSRYKELFLYSLVPSLIILVLVHAPLGLLNPGTAIRWRLNFEPLFYLAPLLLFFNSQGNLSRGNEDHSPAS